MRVTGIILCPVTSLSTEYITVSLTASFCPFFSPLLLSRPVSLPLFLSPLNLFPVSFLFPCSSSSSLLISFYMPLSIFSSLYSIIYSPPLPPSLLPTHFVFLFTALHPFSFPHLLDSILFSLPSIPQSVTLSIDLISVLGLPLPFVLSSLPLSSSLTMSLTHLFFHS